MINNYLDYVKGMRKCAVKAMWEARRFASIDPTRWGKGFYAGHAQARSFEARHWRMLQKDMEAVVKDIEGMFPEEEAAYIGQRFY